MKMTQNNMLKNKWFWLVFLVCGTTWLLMELSGINQFSLAWAAENNETIVTRHAIMVGGEKIAYTAAVGFIPIVDRKSGMEEAKIFYIAYTREGIEDQSNRPVTFAFNGGPGVASMLLHLGAFGPRVVEKSEDGTRLLPPPYGVVDNPNTLLDITDLVFIDPVGTGFSKVVGNTDATQFWGVSEDVYNITEFIRAYLTGNGRAISPIFIAGESYGGARAAGLAKGLQDSGIYPLGIICISPVFDFENIQWSSLGDRALALAIPTYAAAAWYHKKINPRLQGDLDMALQEVRHWVENEYLKALWKGNALTDEEREQIITRLSEYTGLSPEYIEKNNLRVFEDDFATELLGEKGLSIGIYDVRVTFPGPYEDEDDPSFFILTGPFKASLADYFKKELQYENHLSYLSGSAEVYEKWNWESGRPTPKYSGTVSLGYPDVSAELSKAMRRCEFLKVFIASGVYDLECPYDSVLYSVNHFDLPPERHDNITLRLYPGGHMIYTNPEAHTALKKDLAEFYREALGE